MRFFLDENLSPTIATVARGLGLDVVTSAELNRNGLPDLQQLRLAASDGHRLVTANRDDYINLTTQLPEAGEPHAGVLIVPSSWTTAGFSRIAQALKA